MAERARFEIFPTSEGRYQWWFRIDGDVMCRSVHSFLSRDAANDDIHEFMRAIDSADCGIHPDIIDLDAADV